MGQNAIIAAVGQFPPPVSGFSLITEQMTNHLQSTQDVIRLDISAPVGSAGLKKHWSRAVATMSACAAILKLSRKLLMNTYVGCEGGYGLIYTIALMIASSPFCRTTVLHHHSFRYIERFSFLMFIITRCFKTTTHVFLCDGMRRRFEIRYGAVHQACIVSNAAFVDQPPEASRTNEAGRIVIGHLSNLSAEKGLYTFLSLISEAVSIDGRVHGLLAGPVHNTKDETAIQKAVSDLSGRLSYLGAVYGEKKVDFYNQVDIFVMPTNYINEAQPTVIFEAQAAGCRVVSSDRGCIADQLDNRAEDIAPGGDFIAHMLTIVEQFTNQRSDVRGKYLEKRLQAIQSADQLSMRFK